MKKFIVLVLLMEILLSSIACSLNENPTMLNEIGSSNTTPIYVTYPSVIVTVNQTDVTGWSGLLADDQHILDTEAISAIENAGTLTLSGTLDLSGNRLNNPTFIRGNSTLIVIGSSGSSSHSLNDDNDLLVAGDFETNGTHFADGITQMTGDLIAGQDATLRAWNTDGSYYTIEARDTGAGLVEVSRLQGAVDAYISMGSAQEFKYYSSGYLEATGYITTDNYIEYVEMPPPSAGSANTARMYALAGAGDNLTDMAIVFQDGTVDIFAQETTPLTSPIFTQASGTTLEYKIIKPHAGLILFVVEFPNGEIFEIKRLEYHDSEKISANKGVINNKLPDNWLVETKEERENRNKKKLKYEFYISENGTRSIK